MAAGFAAAFLAAGLAAGFAAAFLAAGLAAAFAAGFAAGFAAAFFAAGFFASGGFGAVAILFLLQIRWKCSDKVKIRSTSDKRIIHRHKHAFCLR